MKQRLLRIIVLLWIGWYVSGPIAETIDHWDGPHQEIHDIMFNAGGRVTLVACAFAMVVLQAKKLRDLCFAPQHCEGLAVAGALLAPAFTRFHSSPASIHSPPTPLRI